MKAQQTKRKNLAKFLSLIQRGQFFLLFFLFFAFTAVAQENTLTRISSTERSDGQGYVIRYHLDQKADSFKVFQPTSDLIQVVLYGHNLDTSAVSLPESNEVIDEINLYELPRGIGVDININEAIYFRAKAYADKGSNDLLLGLTYTTKQEMQHLTEGLESISWTQMATAGEDILLNDPAQVDQISLVDDAYERVKNKMKFDVVVIDPGHGGHDPGSIGYNGVREKDVTLAIAHRVGDYIEQNIPGVKVVYTRDDDTFVELEERGSIANRAEGDLFISIHCNAHTSRYAYGTEVYFLGLEKSKDALETMKRENSVIRLENGGNENNLTPEDLLIYELANSGYIATSETVAGLMEYQFRERARRHSRGVKQARLVVLYHASMPAVLVETGFISNPNEARYLSSDRGQAYIASAIYRAVKEYKEKYEDSQHFTTN